MSNHKRNVLQGRTPRLRYAVKGRMLEFLCWREFCQVLVILLMQSEIFRGSVRRLLEMLCLICVWKGLTEFTFLAKILSSTCEVWGFFSRS